MQDYNFWADLLASYRASPDIVKALWVLVPLSLVAGPVAIGLAVALRKPEPPGNEAGASISGEKGWEEAGRPATAADVRLIEMRAEKPYVSHRLPSR